MSNKRDEEVLRIDFASLFRVLWNNALVIVLIALLSGAAAFTYTRLFVTPKYEAVASMYVNNSSFTFGATSFSISSSELQASNSLVDTYIYLLFSRTTLESVIADTGVDYDYQEMKGGIVKAEGVSNTAAFEVTVTSSSPQEAELIANSIARILPERISETVDGTSVRIVDYAIIPAKRSSPSYTKVVVISTVLAGMLACAVVALLSLVGDARLDILRSADDITEAYPRLHILAVIPDMSMPEKKGAYDYYSSYYGPGQSTTKTGKKKGGK